MSLDGLVFLPQETEKTNQLTLANKRGIFELRGKTGILIQEKILSPLHKTLPALTEQKVMSPLVLLVDSKS
jgi:hypothetical protein